MKAVNVCCLLSLFFINVEAGWAQTPSRLEIRSITTNIVTLSFSNASVGATYRLHGSTNLISSNVWFSINDIMTATDTCVSIIDQTTDWVRYYRLVLYTNHTSGWFPFSIPWDDVSNTPLSATDLLVDFPGQNPATVIDNRGYVRAGSNGHFYFANTHQRAKFWGIHLSFDAALPPCPDAPFQPGEFPDNSISEKIAERLATMGFNAVRLTHNDYPYGESNDTLLDYYHSNHDTQHFLTNSLIRLDYLIYQLKRRGIYVDLIMHCARQFRDEDGVRDANNNFYGDNYNNNSTLFDPVMIAVQKKYAHDLLTHTNRYTGLRYADDPTILFTEITNEDSLFLGWCKGLLNYDATVTSSLPRAYSEELDGRGINRLSNGSFENTDLTPWRVWVHTSAVATAGTDDSTTTEGAHSVQVTVHQAGTNSGYVQLSQPNLAIQSGHVYTVSFSAKAEATTNIEVLVMNGRDPWDYSVFYQPLTLTTQWLWHSSTFTSTVTDLGGAQFVFLFGKAQTTLWFDNARFEECEYWDNDQMENGGFENSNSTPWYLWSLSEGTAACYPDTTTAAEGAHSLRITVDPSISESWQVQLQQMNVAVQSSHVYSVRFAAKAATTTTMEVLIMQNQTPWTQYGLDVNIALTTNWQWYSYVFTSTVADVGAKLNFYVGKTQPTLWLDGVRFEERVGFRGWLDWLRDRYGTDEAIRNAWAPTETVDTFNQITNSGFENGFDHWAQHLVSNTLASFSIDDTTAYSNAHSLKMDVTNVNGFQGDVSFSQLSLSTSPRTALRSHFCRQGDANDHGQHLLESRPGSLDTLQLCGRDRIDDELGPLQPASFYFLHNRPRACSTCLLRGDFHWCPLVRSDRIAGI